VTEARAKADLVKFLTDKKLDSIRDKLEQIYAVYRDNTTEEEAERKFRENVHNRVISRIIAERKQKKTKERLGDSYVPKVRNPFDLLPDITDEPEP
jgi:hypothetical protein